MDDPEPPPTDSLSSGSRPGESVLAAIERRHGVGSNLSLRDADGPEPPSPDRPADETVGGDERYQVLGEIARGGVGIVYRCLDRDLNRQVALKVLRPEYEDRTDVIQRFIEEAQVGGQLQHPGIVPVYGIGLQENGRPSFAMKLIRGRTLAELMSEGEDVTALLTIFEQIVRTVAYAHARGVIHRDLKPANVMVGAYGEVQVVDWGFAKILGQEDPTPAPGRSTVATIRSGPEGSQSIAGNVLGTPAYMPPEQARAEAGKVGRQADVFSLGAILLEILSGAPPYVGTPLEQLLAARGCATDAAGARLDAADAADELKALVRDCLRPAPEDRPGSAGVVADRLTAYLAGVEERARHSELEALEAGRRAARERHARRRSVVLATSALLLLAAGVGAYLFWRMDLDAREARAGPLIAAAMREARTHEGERDWPAAVAAARRARDLAASEGIHGAAADALLARMEHEKRSADETARIAAEDDALLEELDQVRGRLLLAALDTVDRAGLDAAYAAAFGRLVEPIGASAGRLASSRHAPEFAAHLDAWSRLRGSPELADLANRVDPRGAAVRAALDGDAGALADVLREPPGDLPPSLAPALGLVLADRGDLAGALRLLREQAVLAPADVWTHLALASVAIRSAEPALAAHHATAAVAARPRLGAAWEMLAAACRANGDEAGAELAARRAGASR